LPSIGSPKLTRYFIKSVPLAELKVRPDRANAPVKVKVSIPARLSLGLWKRNVTLQTVCEEVQKYQGKKNPREYPLNKSPKMSKLRVGVENALCFSSILLGGYAVYEAFSGWIVPASLGGIFSFLSTEARQFSIQRRVTADNLLHYFMAKDVAPGDERDYVPSIMTQKVTDPYIRNVKVDIKSVITGSQKTMVKLSFLAARCLGTVKKDECHEKKKLKIISNKLSKYYHILFKREEYLGAVHDNLQKYQEMKWPGREDWGKTSNSLKRFGYYARTEKISYYSGILMGGYSLYNLFFDSILTGAVSLTLSLSLTFGSRLLKNRRRYAENLSQFLRYKTAKEIFK